MENRIVNTRSMPELRGKSGRAFFEYGLWLRAGFIGVSALAAGLIQLFDGEVKPLSAVAMLVGGGLLAAFSGWRARTALDLADAAAPQRAGTQSTVNARAAAGA